MQPLHACRIISGMPINNKQIFGHNFNNPELLRQALTHPSYLNESNQVFSNDYQRLEFLGDAVLGLLLADLLFRHFPDLTEGNLSKLRSSLVDQKSLAKLALNSEIAPLILMGKGTEHEGGRNKPSILADVFESVIGAIYSDAGFDAARQAVEQIYSGLIAELKLNPLKFNDHKSELQEKLAARKLPAPFYYILDDEGPDHQKLFTAAVSIADKEIGKGVGQSKKTAQQNAAKAALTYLESLST